MFNKGKVLRTSQMKTYLEPKEIDRIEQAAGFTWMPAATLSFDYLYHIIAKNKIELPMERHSD